jgi:hypothetical protein
MKHLFYIFGILVLGLVLVFPQTSEGQSACAQAIGEVTSRWNPSFNQSSVSNLDQNCEYSIFFLIERNRQIANGMSQIALESVWIDLHY